MKRAVLLLIVLLSACTSETEQNQAASSDTASRQFRAVAGLMKGMVSRTNSGLRLVACSGTDTLHLVGGGEDAEIKGDTQVFAVVRLSPSAGGPEVQEVLYQTPDRTDCFADFTTFDYRATGSGPGWVVEVKGDSMKVRHQGGADTVIHIVKRDSGDAALALSGAGQASLQLTKQSCESPTARSTSALRAQLTVRGRTFNGCAIPGVPDR